MLTKISILCIVTIVGVWAEDDNKDKDEGAGAPKAPQMYYYPYPYYTYPYYYPYYFYGKREAKDDTEPPKTDVLPVPDMVPAPLTTTVPPKPAARRIMGRAFRPTYRSLAPMAWPGFSKHEQLASQFRSQMSF
ncbi:hypothetical protein M3Y98_00809700 [Aphelenchoides besseyi]|nr:hypothetical protein M3Y98_00809700 [Aphelenchoides besseyi]KAI6212120.1 hypothetical protein M3Y96_00506800 [Aphelenchoides besseyi]